MTGAQINMLLKLKARHSLYREDGKWYHHLKEFPGILFDKTGYILFRQQRDYIRNPFLQHKHDLHIRNGISNIVGYKRFSKDQHNKISRLYDHSTKDNSFKKRVFAFKHSMPSEISSNRRRNVEKSIEICNLHREVSKGLYEYLSRIYGVSNLSCDCATAGGTFIDMVRRDTNGFIFYEIKTYANLRESIREALGQLFEYAYWNCQKLAKELVIVTERPPNQNVRNYFKFIRKQFRIPIFYQQFDLKKEILLKKC